jgi:hypothetical protein
MLKAQTARGWARGAGCSHARPVATRAVRDGDKVRTSVHLWGLIFARLPGTRFDGGFSSERRTAAPPLLPPLAPAAPRPRPHTVHIQLAPNSDWAARTAALPQPVGETLATGGMALLSALSLAGAAHADADPTYEVGAAPPPPLLSAPPATPLPPPPPLLQTAVIATAATPLRCVAPPA